MNPFPPYPNLRAESSSRLATGNDLQALAELLSLVNTDSQFFRYICPFLDRFPEDNFAYLKRVAEFNLRDPRTVVVVVDDVDSFSLRGTPERSDGESPQREDTPQGTWVVGMAV